MTNLAAVIPAAKARLEVREVETYKPGPHELFIRNEVIAYNPVEAKAAKLALFPLEYPTILGTSYGGTVEAVGEGVTRFKPGDKVAVMKHGGLEKDGQRVRTEKSSYQRYVIADEDAASPVPEGVDVAVSASFMGNLPSVVGLLTGRIGLGKPSFEGEVEEKGKKVLVYGGSSSLGSLAVQYLAQAGYAVVTTTSPRNEDFVAKLGAAKVVDHSQEKDVVVKELVAEGPYEAVVDAVSLPNTVPVAGAVLVAQGGGKLYATLPAFGPETVPEGVEREFASWGAPLKEEKNAGLLDWAFTTYLPEGLAKGKIIPLPIEKIGGGLKGANEALDRLFQGVSGVKLVGDPWE